MSNNEEYLRNVRDAIKSLLGSVQEAMEGRLAVRELVAKYVATRRLLNQQFSELVESDLSKPAGLLEQTRFRVADQMAKLFGGRGVDRYLRVAPYSGVHPVLLEYLAARPRTDVPASELRLLTGDQVHTERRLRELRDLGFELTWRKVGEEFTYRLERLEPDLDSAARFQLEHRITEDRSINATEKMLRLLKAELGRPVHTERLSQLSGGQAQYDRRIRDLRERFHISTGLSKPTLAPDQYQLESLDEKDPHDRFKTATIRNIFQRDGYTCKDCGWSKNDASTSPRYLEAHHVQPRSGGGESTADNGVTLCNLCHSGRHAAK